MQVLQPYQGWLVILGIALLMIVAVNLVFRSRAVNTKMGYLLGGGSIPWQITGLGIAATWTWAIAVFVAAERAYLSGWVGLFWFTVPNVMALVGFSFAAKKVRERYPNGFTLSGVMRDRFSPRVSRVYQVTLIGLAVASTAVQLLAGGVVASHLTGIDFTAMTIALSVIAMAYTMRAGFGASVLSDVIGLAFILVFGVGTALAVVKSAGISTLTNGLGGIDGDHTHLLTGAGGLLFITFGINSVITLMAGPWGDQNYWQYGWATSRQHAQRAFLLGAGLFALIPTSMGLIGLTVAGAGIVPVDTQLVNLAGVIEWLPTWTLYAFIAYALAVLVTTMDSNFAVIAAFVGHDFSRGKDDRTVVRRSRLAIAGLTALSILIANVPGITLTGLWFFYGTFRIATFLPTVLTLFSRYATEKGMFWGITTACVIGIPLSVWGNFMGVWQATVAAALGTMLLSGGIVLVTGMVTEGRKRAAEVAKEVA